MIQEVFNVIRELRNIVSVLSLNVSETNYFEKTIINRLIREANLFATEIERLDISKKDSIDLAKKLKKRMVIKTKRLIFLYKFAKAIRILFKIMDPLIRSVLSY